MATSTRTCRRTRAAYIAGVRRVAGEGGACRPLQHKLVNSVAGKARAEVATAVSQSRQADLRTRT